MALKHSFWFSTLIINLFYVIGFFLYPPENVRKPQIFRGYRKIVGEIVVMRLCHILIFWVTGNRVLNSQHFNADYFRANLVYFCVIFRPINVLGIWSLLSWLWSLWTKIGKQNNFSYTINNADAIYIFNFLLKIIR